MNNITEAKRYLDNAKSILKNQAQKENGIYQDKKYVKLAGHAAYLGVLMALDGVLGHKSKGRKSVEWYKAELTKLDRRMTSIFDAAYSTLHLSMSYDGNPSAGVATEGLKQAEQIINWVENKTVTA